MAYVPPLPGNGVEGRFDILHVSNPFVQHHESPTMFAVGPHVYGWDTLAVATDQIFEIVATKPLVRTKAGPYAGTKLTVEQKSVYRCPTSDSAYFAVLKLFNMLNLMLFYGRQILSQTNGASQVNI